MRHINAKRQTYSIQVKVRHTDIIELAADKILEYQTKAIQIHN